MEIDYKILFEDLKRKMHAALELQKKKDQAKNWFTYQDKNRLWNLKKEIHDMILRDEEALSIYLKNKRVLK
jgi:hypothetical protein